MVKWHLISSRLIYQSPYLALYEDLLETPRGLKIQYSRLNLKDFVSIIPITSKNTIVMVENLRYPLNDWSLELPSGHIEKSETALNAARREVKEEIGYEGGNFSLLMWYYPNPGRSWQKAYLIVGNNLNRGMKASTRDEEMIKVREMTVKKVFDNLHAGKIKHPPSIIALLLYEKNLKKAR